MRTKKKWKQLLPTMLLLLLATVAFTACGSGEAEVLAPAEEETPVGSELVVDHSFELLDANANGKLEEREFSLLLVQADIGIQGQFGSYDANEDQHLDKQEYAAFLEDKGLFDAAEVIEDELGALTPGGDS